MNQWLIIVEMSYHFSNNLGILEEASYKHLSNTMFSKYLTVLDWIFVFLNQNSYVEALTQQCDDIWRWGFEE